MRALIRCTTSLQDADVVDFAKNWLELWPPLEQESPEAAAKKAEILSTVSQDDKAISDKTYKCTVFDHECRTWGTVHYWEKHIDIRLKHHDSARLKSVCERIVTAVRARDKKTRKEKKCRERRKHQPAVTFHDKISVFEPNSGHSAYTGTIMPPTTLWSAVRQRTQESVAAAVLFIIGSASLVATLSSIQEQLPPKVGLWVAGILERLGTSFIGAAVVTFISVLLHYIQLKRKSTIEWRLEE